MTKISEVDLSSSEAPPLIKTNFSEFVQECHKCADLAQRIATYFPEVPGIWTGNPSERLTVAFEHMWSLINQEEENQESKMVPYRVSWIGTGEVTFPTWVYNSNPRKGSEFIVVKELPDGVYNDDRPYYKLYPPGYPEQTFLMAQEHFSSL